MSKEPKTKRDYGTAVDEILGGAVTAYKSKHGLNDGAMSKLVGCGHNTIYKARKCKPLSLYMRDKLWAFIREDKPTEQQDGLPFDTPDELHAQLATAREEIARLNRIIDRLLDR